MVSWEYTGFGTALTSITTATGGRISSSPTARSRFGRSSWRPATPTPCAEPNLLFRNVEGGRFEDVTGTVGGARSIRRKVGRGVAAGDHRSRWGHRSVDQQQCGASGALLNQVGSQSHWLGLRLIDRKSGRDLVGTKVAATLADGSVLWRRSATDGSFASSNDPVYSFGLGDEDRCHEAACLSGRTVPSPNGETSPSIRISM